MVYIQSSGGSFPRIFSGKINHWTNFLEDLFKFLGVKQFEKLMIEGTGEKSIGVQEAEAEAFEKMDKIISKMS